MSAQEFHKKMLGLVQTERKITDLILKMINEAEQNKTYAELGFSSCYEYLTKGLSYSAPAAYRRLHSARLLREVPQLQRFLLQGEINLSQLALISQAVRQTQKASGEKITLEQKQELIDKLRRKSIFETKKILVENFEYYIPSSTELLPQARGQVQIILHLNEEQLQLLKNAQSQLSHAIPSHDVKDLLLYFCQRAVKQRKAMTPKPLEKSSQDKPRKISTASQAKQIIRQKISIKLKRQIEQRADRQCEYVSPQNAQRCSSRSFLEMDHIRPVAFGGKNELQNLRLYCRSHNQLAALKVGLWKNKATS